MDSIADYVLHAQMGNGNHGTFYRATPPARLGIDDEFVALKVLNNQATDDDFRRIANELRLLNSLESEYLVRLIDAGNAKGRLFLTTRYYAEGSLDDAHGRIDAAITLRAVSDAAFGAHALHEVGVAHRDIKPTNVLLDSGRGYLADLGLAQLLDQTTTTTGAGPIGSIEYIDPEIIWGNQASRRTDVWSLAMTMYRALTGTGALGEIPTTGILDACKHVLHTRPNFDAAPNDKTREVLERATAEDHDARYATAAEFAGDVLSLAEGAQ